MIKSIQIEHLKYFLVTLLLFVFYSSAAQRNDVLLDSVYELINFSNDINYSNKERIKFAERASELSIKLNLDTTILKSNKNLSLIYVNQGNYDAFANINKKNLDLANKIQDSLAVADANFNLGWYNQYNSDSEEAYKYYLEALNYFQLKKISKRSAVTLTNIASIQDDEKDYLGSEQNAIEALQILNTIEDEDVEIDKYYCLNLLGNVSYKLKNFDKAIDYHNQALKILKRTSGGDLESLYTQNNIAIAYRDKGNYTKTLEIYQDLIKEPNLREEDPSFYALLLANNAYTEFLNNTYNLNDLEAHFKEAIHISDSLDDEVTKLSVSIDLAKFYNKTNRQDSSLKYANQSYRISKEIVANELLLESMLLLADLTEGEQSKTYLAEHIKLSDSLLGVERSKRNKFARIKYETDQLEEENKRFARDKIFLTAISAILLIAAILIYIIITQRARNKELKLIQEQQKANEEIYNLMLHQQDKVDEARIQEKKRMSQELHDGVLGKLFGTRLSLDSLNFSNGPEVVNNRSNYINQLKQIEDDIRKISHELNTDFVSGSGFMDIVSELIENQSKAYGLKYKFQFSDDISWENISNKTKINLYRIVQESMQNIYKHANAKHIYISINHKNDVICLDIKDDGKGFDVTKNKRGIGLKNMRSRVGDMSGKITFNSKVGKGTTVNVEIPYYSEEI